MDRIVARAGTTTFEISSLDPDPAGVIELLTLVQDPLQAAASTGTGNYIAIYYTVYIQRAKETDYQLEVDTLYFTMDMF